MMNPSVLVTRLIGTQSQSYLRFVVEEEKSKMSFVFTDLKEVENIFDELFESCVFVSSNLFASV